MRKLPKKGYARGRSRASKRTRDRRLARSERLRAEFTSDAKARAVAAANGLRLKPRCANCGSTCRPVLALDPARGPGGVYVCSVRLRLAGMVVGRACRHTGHSVYAMR